MKKPKKNQKKNNIYKLFGEGPYSKTSGILFFFFFLFFCFFRWFLQFGLQYLWTIQFFVVFVLQACTSHTCPELKSLFSGSHPSGHVSLIFSWFGHPPRKMRGNTKQPRFEHMISKQVSAWPQTFVFKPSNTCLMQSQFFQRTRYSQHSQIFP